LSSLLLFRDRIHGRSLSMMQMKMMPHAILST
jgi:hypothetical protein